MLNGGADGDVIGGDITRLGEKLRGGKLPCRCSGGRPKVAAKAGLETPAPERSGGGGDCAGCTACPAKERKELSLPRLGVRDGDGEGGLKGWLPSSIFVKSWIMSPSLILFRPLFSDGVTEMEGEGAGVGSADEAPPNDLSVSVTTLSAGAPPNCWHSEICRIHCCLASRDSVCTSSFSFLRMMIVNVLS